MGPGSEGGPHGASSADGTAWQPTGHQFRRRAADLRDLVALRADPRYRRLARAYELPDGSKRVFCYHIRKTAGTSLFHSFMALGGEDPIVVWRRLAASRLARAISGRYSFVVQHRLPLAEGAYFFGRAHHTFEERPVLPGTFTVTVLRDPVARVHSLFDFAVAGDDPDQPVRVSEAFRRKADEGFDAFLDRIPPVFFLNQLGMFSSRFDISEAVDRIASCSSVFFTEDFPEGLAALATRLDLPLQEYHARVNTSRSSLTDEQLERLRSRLEPEYELLRRLEEGGIARPGSVHSA